MVTEENKNAINIILDWQIAYFKKLFTENNFSFLSDLKEKIEFEKFCRNISVALSSCVTEQYLISKDKYDFGRLFFLNAENLFENNFENNTHKIFQKIRADLRKDVVASFVEANVKFNEFIVGNFIIGNILGNRKIITDMFFAAATDYIFPNIVDTDKIHYFVNGMKELHKEENLNKLSKALMVSIFYSGLFLNNYNGEDISTINKICLEELNKLITINSDKIINDLI